MVKPFTGHPLKIPGRSASGAYQTATVPDGSCGRLLDMLRDALREKEAKLRSGQLIKSTWGEWSQPKDRDIRHL